MRKYLILMTVSVLMACSGENGVMRNYQEQLEFDMQRIDGYIAENQLTGFQKTPSGLYYKITQEGNGRKAVRGNTVTVDYIGRKLNNQVFDSSQSGQPFSFILGVGQVIQGWDEGIALISEEGAAKLIIPSGLAYGPQRVGGSIGANEILVFDVNVLRIQ